MIFNVGPLSTLALIAGAIEPSDDHHGLNVKAR
jgi:hypothetical protein